ncbi:M48 family metalloprotease [Akkermansiaceae bacterium]|nr:M48 family metalloprotease [Akkermansiaceae bacterium]
MAEILEWLGAYSFRASLLCLATLLILAALKSVSASVRSGIIFAGTLGAIILPVSVRILPPISLSGIFTEPVSESIPLEGLAPVAESRVGLVGHEVAPEVLDIAGMPQAFASQKSVSSAWVNALGWVWVLGVLISLAMLIGRIVSVVRMRSHSRLLSLNHPLVAEANAASAKVRFGKSPEVRVSEKISVPSAIGLGFKTILLPVGFEQLDRAAREAVLVHECAHLRRRDSLVQVLISLCRCLHWFNPLFLALDRTFNAEAEKACDDQVIGGGISPDAYSEIILYYYQTASAGKPGSVWNSSASGFYPCPQLDRKLHGRKKMILTRIRRMVDPAARRTGLGVVLGWVLVGTASVSASVLGALVFVPDYEWRYQLTERSLPYSDQLVACWRMDEIRSNATPDSGSRRLFGKVDGGTLDENGRLDHAIYLDGDDFVDMGDQFGGLEFPITLTAWVRADTDAESASQNVVWLGGGLGNQYIYIGLNRGRPAIKSRNGEMAVVLGKPNIADGEWHHLAGVFESESRRLLYLDGELVAEDTRLAIKPPTLHLQIGRNGRKNQETSYIQGAIDDVRVYSANLDEQSVREIMKGDFALVAAKEEVE